MHASADRRRFLKSSAIAAAALALGDFLHLRGRAAAATASADACILVFLNGGMSHLDTFDPKPDQPAEIRGEFTTIPTSAPGIRVTEHLQLVARQMHRCTIVRTVGFDGRLQNHSPACYHMLTGREPQGEAAVLAPPRPTDHPTFGAAASRLRPTSGAIPAFAMAPDVLIENAHLTPGQFAGWLGSRHEAFNVKSDPSQPTFALPALAPAADMNEQRLVARRELLRRLNREQPRLAAMPAGRELDPFYERAFDLLTAGRAQAAFQIAAEPARLREQYGMNVVGQSLLLARRLVEAGVRFVNVHWPNVGGGKNWDTHSDGFNRLKNALLPPTDRGLAALLADLADRGRLERTLVVLMTEFGRAPQIGKTFQNAGGPAGRDHWSNCFSIVLAGGGIAGGRTHGSSDAKGGYPADRPVTPADIAATIYRTLGIDPDVTLHDAEGRTHRLCDGAPIRELFA
jgi:uncharacterized protein (DUF1501 family)